MAHSRSLYDATRRLRIPDVSLVSPRRNASPSTTHTGPRTDRFPRAEEKRLPRDPLNVCGWVFTTEDVDGSVSRNPTRKGLIQSNSVQVGISPTVSNHSYLLTLANSRTRVGEQRDRADRIAQPSSSSEIISEGEEHGDRTAEEHLTCLICEQPFPSISGLSSAPT